ncbi:hypothetical protein JKF63_07582 [Porcisia hertigi]|uniref:Uncharacterized protein n=1 Tax=Porcisia hertigi TaxID=2761500 RepID=A0A836YJZ2_9TRYP|nr:hypothetical protein JKF63_07582 [Porcisia hertigi]
MAPVLVWRRGGGVGHGQKGCCSQLLHRSVAITAVVVMIILEDVGFAAHAFNVCSAIGRCSECVYDQTDGLMPPPLMCGWCESTQTCKEVNSTVLSYYRATFPNSKVDGNGEETIEHTPAEIAAFRAQFCEDFRERSFNPVCPDMSCAASRTTNNIYICRASSITALVFGCILFALSMLMYVWMQTIRQLPWKYEPFISDLLAGRHRAPDVGGGSGPWEGNHDTHSTVAAPHIPALPAAQRPYNTAKPCRDREGVTEGFGERDGCGGGDGECRASDRESSSPAAWQSGQVAVPLQGTSFGAASTVTTTAVSGHCPICKCRQPVRLGPGDVCFWCNIARFAFVPFSLALLSSLIVIVLSFAVSLKPWFSDVYFAEVLIVAYVSLGSFLWYVVRYHRRVPLFFSEPEATCEASEADVLHTVQRQRPTLLSPSAAASAPPVTVATASTTVGCSTPSLQCPFEAKSRLLNDARRNMANTTYVALALRLCGRPLLDQFPELRRYHTQIESMRVAPATMSGGGTRVTAMPMPMTAAAAGAGAGAAMMDSGAPAISHSSEIMSNAVAAAGTPIQGNTTAGVSTASSIAAAAAASSNLFLPSQTTCLAQHPATYSMLSPLSAPTSDVGRIDMMSGKPMSTLFSDVRGATTAASASAPPPAASCSATAVLVSPRAALPERVARQKRGETAQLLNSDFLSPQYRKALKATLSTGEYITWCSKPQIRGVLMDNEWLLLGLLAGVLFGIWMLLLSSVSDRSYAVVRLSGSTAVAACGLVVMVGFAVLLIVVIRSCCRLYVLTNERLITLCEGLVELGVTSTDLSSVRFAALYGYRSIWSREPVMEFSWEVPASERKMPVIKSHKFSGIVNVHEFLYYFHLVAPQMPSHLQQISESTRTCRTEWRLHVVLSIGLFIASPIITVYPHAIPDFLAAYLYVVVLLLIYSTLLHGLRMQHMTCAPLSIAASWVPGRMWNEMNGEISQQPPPSLMAQSPSSYVMDTATPSSMCNTKGSQGFGKLHVPRSSLPTEPNSRGDLCVMDTECGGARGAASTVRVCCKASVLPSSRMRPLPSGPGGLKSDHSGGASSADAVANGTVVPESPTEKRCTTSTPMCSSVVVVNTATLVSSECGEGRLGQLQHGESAPPGAA